MTSDNLPTEATMPHYRDIADEGFEKFVKDNPGAIIKDSGVRLPFAPVAQAAGDEVEGLADALFWQKYQRAQVPESFDQSRLTELRKVAEWVIAAGYRSPAQVEAAKAEALNRGIRLAARLIRDHTLGTGGEPFARFLEERADRGGSDG